MAKLKRKSVKKPSKKAATKEDIRQDLLDQLDRQGIFGSHYTDLVDDYMSLWEIKNALIADIKERGVSVKWQNGANQWGYKKNDSVSELTRITAQMLKILADLGLKGSQLDPPKEEDDDEM